LEGEVQEDDNSSISEDLASKISIIGLVGVNIRKSGSILIISVFVGERRGDVPLGSVEEVYCLGAILLVI